jgi:hypothetical protein
MERVGRRIVEEGLVARSRRSQPVGPGRAGLERQVDVEGARKASASAMIARAAVKTTARSSAP